MPAKIVGTCHRVVDAENFCIDELIGNVSTKQDQLSVAKVAAKAGAAEPWLTVLYTEWLCVTKGRIVLKLCPAGGSEELVLTVKAGETVEIEPGTRFQPSFPEDTEYIPICVPAFRPDRCIREDTDAHGEEIAAKLKELHGHKKKLAPGEEECPEVLYHMCKASLWEEAKMSGKAYFPPTFAEDDHLTHATAVPSRLIDTANHYYQDVQGDWVCLEFTRSALRDRGIFVRDEHATAVGEKPVDSEMMHNWVCPHVIGGLPLNVVRREYKMRREGSKFLSIDGLVD